MKTKIDCNCSKYGKQYSSYHDQLQFNEYRLHNTVHEIYHEIFETLRALQFKSGKWFLYQRADGLWNSLPATAIWWDCILLTNADEIKREEKVTLYSLGRYSIMISWSHRCSTRVTPHYDATSKCNTTRSICRFSSQLKHKEFLPTYPLSQAVIIIFWI